MMPASASPRALGVSLWKHRELLWQMTVRDIASRYRGSALGLLWSFVTPLLMLAVYTFVFGVVFQARFGAGAAAENPSTLQFALTLFCGLIIHALVAECLGRAPNIILAHTSYVKKVVFPLEILPVMVLASACFHFLMSTGVLLLGLLLAHGSLPLSALWFPLTILPLLPVLLGVNWVLAALGVYLRDIGQLSGLLAMLLMFLSPIFYPVESLPEAFRPFMYLNPLTHIIEAARGALILGIRPDVGMLAAYMSAGIAFACVGFWWFQKTRSGFADIL
jgi:lipopolysaccharide transport system permease protein